MTDRQTNARGKTICLPTLSGGDINSVMTTHVLTLLWEYVTSLTASITTMSIFIENISIEGDKILF